MATRSTVSYGTKTDFTPAGLATLAAATYITTAPKDTTVTQPDDLMVELVCAVGTAPTGLQQVTLFAQDSFDGGGTWQTGPTTGTTNTDEGTLTPIGVLPIRQASSTQRSRAFSVANAFGYVPPNIRFVIKNETGVALTVGSISIVEATVQSA